MKKILIFLLLVIYSIFFSQKCENISQHIDANGHFNISTIDEETYNYQLKDSVQFTTPIRNNNKITLSDFQKKFPKVYDGKCIIINDKNFLPENFKFCNISQRELIGQNENILFGKFVVDSYLDEYYIIKFSGFEIGGYIIFDSINDKMFYFDSEPKFSLNKKIMFGYHNDYQGFKLDFRKMDGSRNIKYTIMGTYDINDINLLQFPNTLNFQLLLNLTETIRVRDDDFNFVGIKTCDLKVAIN